MAKAGASVDVILAAVEAELVAEGERVQARRAKDAERQRRWRARDSVESQPVTRSHCDTKVSLSSLLSSSTSITKEEEKKEERKKERKERARKIPVPPDWKPNEAHYAKAAILGIPADLMLMKADDMRNWAKSKAVIRADWDATFFGFLRPHDSVNGHGAAPRPGSKEDTRERTVNALRALDPFPREDEPRPSESFGAPVSRQLSFAKPTRS